MSRAEYMRKYRKSKSATVTPVTPDQPRVTPVTRNKSGIEWHPEIDQAIFDGHGRGSPVNGYVLVSLGAVQDGKPDCGVVSEPAWRDRLTHTCTHGLAGWSCKECITQ